MSHAKGEGNEEKGNACFTVSILVMSGLTKLYIGNCDCLNHNTDTPVPEKQIWNNGIYYLFSIAVLLGVRLATAWKLAQGFKAGSGRALGLCQVPPAALSVWKSVRN